jgi:hypothetical protein
MWLDAWYWLPVACTMELNTGATAREARRETVENLRRHDDGGNDGGRAYPGHCASYGRGYPAHPSGLPYFQEPADRRLHDLDPH